MQTETAIPEGQIRWLVNRLHVNTPTADIEADIRRRTNGWPEASITKAIAYALKCHHDNRALYGQVMSGQIK